MVRTRAWALVVVVTVLGWGGSLGAETVEPSAVDRAWRSLLLYQDPERAGLQSLALVGRAQLDSVWVDPRSDEESFEDTAWRRFRFGLKAGLFERGTAHVEVDLDLNEPVEDWYSQLTDAYLAWDPSEDLTIKVLKQSAGFTLDGATSSKKLMTLERNNLSNNLWFPEEYFTGLLVAGTAAETWTYKAGFFSSDGDPELGWDDAGWFGLVSLGARAGETDFRVDYVYQDADPNANTRDFEQVLSLVGQWQRGSMGIWGDLSGGRGIADLGQDDIWGLVVMPFYDWTDHTQGVFRYTFLSGDGDGSVRLNRYDNEILDDWGDEFHEAYLGFNVYFYGHKLKWQTGMAWVELRNAGDERERYQGLALSTGLRVSW